MPYKLWFVSKGCIKENGTFLLETHVRGSLALNGFCLAGSIKGSWWPSEVSDKASSTWPMGRS